MNKYNNSKIYKISNTINDDIYIGSTTSQYLCSRMNMHRMMAKDTTGRRNSKLYNMMRDLGVVNFKIELVENINCNDKHELHIKEQEYIDSLKPSLNMIKSIPMTADENREYQRIWAEKQRRKNGSKKQSEMTLTKDPNYKHNMYLKYKEQKQNKT